MLSLLACTQHRESLASGSARLPPGGGRGAAFPLDAGEPEPPGPGPATAASGGGRGTRGAPGAPAGGATGFPPCPGPLKDPAQADGAAAVVVVPAVVAETHSALPMALPQVPALPQPWRVLQGEYWGTGSVRRGWQPGVQRRELRDKLPVAAHVQQGAPPECHRPSARVQAKEGGDGDSEGHAHRGAANDDVHVQ